MIEQVKKFCIQQTKVESSWNVMAHGDARVGKWRGNWWMEWVASTLHTTSERGVSSITKADAHTSAASSRLNWRPCRFKWTRPFRRKKKSGFCACVITFQTQSNKFYVWLVHVSSRLCTKAMGWPNFAIDSRHWVLRLEVNLQWSYVVRWEGEAVADCIKHQPHEYDI